jgi:hypothetical protein
MKTIKDIISIVPSYTVQIDASKFEDGNFKIKEELYDKIIPEHYFISHNLKTTFISCNEMWAKYSNSSLYRLFSVNGKLFFQVEDYYDKLEVYLDLEEEKRYDMEVYDSETIMRCRYYQDEK